MWHGDMSPWWWSLYGHLRGTNINNQPLEKHIGHMERWENWGLGRKYQSRVRTVICGASKKCCESGLISGIGPNDHQKAELSQLWMINDPVAVMTLSNRRSALLHCSPELIIHSRKAKPRYLWSVTTFKTFLESRLAWDLGPRFSVLMPYLNLG